MSTPAPFASLIGLTSFEDGPAAVHQAADLLFWLAVVAVPVVLFRHARRQPLPVRRVLSALGMFGACAGIVLALRALPAWATNSVPGTAVAVAAAVVGCMAVVALARRLPAALASGEWGARGEDLERLRLLEAAVSASGDGVMIADATMAADAGPHIVYANPAFERIMGYSAEEALGLSPSVFCHTDSAVRRFGDGAMVPDPETQADEEALLAIRSALRGAEPVRMELPGRRKDGTRVWAEWQVVPVAAADGGSTHWVAVLRDTTERRQLEEQLRESQKMDAIGRLAGGIAHDFNNLLTVIRGNAEILRDVGPELASTPELVDDIRGAAERAAGLVRQLLTFGRRQPARPEVVNLNAVVEEMAGLLRRLLGERITVVTNLAPQTIRARVDRSQFEQVVMNLAVNARDAMPRGGTLTIATSPVTEPRLAGGPLRFARLTVTDTGTGMTAEVRARIFEPFFTTKGPGKGTGLGLATVYGIVTGAQGRLGVDSAPGVGTAFRVDLPWCDDAPGSSSSSYFAAASVNRERQVGRGRSVLLAEDEDAVRKLAKATLESCGYAVTDATDAESAIALLEDGLSIDLLVTDLTMPGMGGRELAGHVRKMRPEVGVVFISGYAPDAGWLDGVPGSVFLPKPFTPADLLKSAGRALARAAKMNGTATATPV
jgi:signal transduction histidine kinase/ActR/RegA family two-component response regulator